MIEIIWFIIGLPAFIIAASIHEYAHAWAAYKLGDPTAKSQGRLTLNPISHIDPLGFLLILFTRFGWSKPVPINERNFENPIKGTALSSLAGPTSNFALAVILSLILRLINNTTGINIDNTYYLQIPITTLLTSFLTMFIQVSILINISLGIFNLLPIPPLDGYRIIRAFLPQKIRYYWDSLENYAQWIILLLVLPITPIGTAISKFISFTVQRIFTLLTGI